MRDKTTQQLSAYDTNSYVRKIQNNSLICKMEPSRYQYYIDGLTKNV